jgi:hypothetical protein
VSWTAPSSPIHHVDVSHHSSVIPINAHHLPINQINITRQSIKRQNSLDLSNLSKPLKRLKLLKPLKLLKQPSVASAFAWIPTIIYS